jgi:hypothetical protein
VLIFPPQIPYGLRSKGASAMPTANSVEHDTALCASILIYKMCGNPFKVEEVKEIVIDETVTRVGIKKIILF